MPFHGGNVFLVDPIDPFPHFPGKLFDEETDILLNIFRSFAQCREMDAENRKPEIEVLAEIPPGDLLFEIPVRGGDHPQIDPFRTCLADLQEFAVFEHTQQFRLQIHRHFTDFVKEQCTSVGLFQQPLFILCGTGKAACLVSEKLAFEQLLGEGRAVYRDKSLFGPGPGVMNGMGKDLLSGSRFAGQQDKGIASGHFPCQLYGLAHGGRGADDTVKRILGRGFRLVTGQTLLQLGLFDGPAQQRQDFVVVVSFRDIVERSVFDRLHAIRDVAIGREQDHLGQWSRLFDLANQIDAIAIGQLDIAQYNFEVILRKHFHAVGAIVGLENFITFKTYDAS